MKKLLIFLLALFSLFSCNTKAYYTTKACKIEIKVESAALSASSVLVNFTPQDERAYYYADIVTKEHFDSVANYERYMQLVLDTKYKDYINWRYDLLLRFEEYVASFVTHSLCYGRDSRYFKDLLPNKEYVLIAFCVNPETNQPNGELFYTPVKTANPSESDMTFQVMFKEREDAPYVSMVPSNDDEFYLWEWAELDTLSAHGFDVRKFANYVVKVWKEHGMAEYMCVKGPQSYKCQEGEMEEGHRYVLIAAGYDSDFTTAIFTYSFNYPFETENEPIDLEIMDL